MDLSWQTAFKKKKVTYFKFFQYYLSLFCNKCAPYRYTHTHTQLHVVYFQENKVQCGKSVLLASRMLSTNILSQYFINFKVFLFIIFFKLLKCTFSSAYPVSGLFRSLETLPMRSNNQMDINTNWLGNGATLLKH